MARIDHNDVVEMRRLELRLATLRKVRDTLEEDIECELDSAAPEALHEVFREISEVEAELDIVGGFDGE